MPVGNCVAVSAISTKSNNSRICSTTNGAGLGSPMEPSCNMRAGCNGMYDSKPTLGFTVRPTVAMALATSYSINESRSAVNTGIIFSRRPGPVTTRPRMAVPPALFTGCTTRPAMRAASSSSLNGCGLITRNCNLPPERLASSLRYSSTR